ncbi:hypothetical protein HKX48_003247, partial [Thoreauomyces humboldtii]
MAKDGGFLEKSVFEDFPGEDKKEGTFHYYLRQGQLAKPLLDNASDVSAGVVYRMYNQEQFMRFQECATLAMVRDDVSVVIAKLHRLAADPQALAFLDLHAESTLD